MNVDRHTLDGSGKSCAQDIGIKLLSRKIDDVALGFFKDVIASQLIRIKQHGRVNHVYGCAVFPLLAPAFDCLGRIGVNGDGRAFFKQRLAKRLDGCGDKRLGDIDGVKRALLYRRDRNGRSRETACNVIFGNYEFAFRSGYGVQRHERRLTSRVVRRDVRKIQSVIRVVTAVQNNILGIITFVGGFDFGKRAVRFFKVPCVGRAEHRAGIESLLKGAAVRNRGFDFCGGAYHRDLNRYYGKFGVKRNVAVKVLKNSDTRAFGKVGVGKPSVESIAGLSGIVKRVLGARDYFHGVGFIVFAVVKLISNRISGLDRGVFARRTSYGNRA